VPETIAPGSGRPAGLAARVRGVLTSPGATYEQVAARPRALGVLALVVLVMAAGYLIFFSTEVGREALVDQEIRWVESFGGTVSDAQYARLEALAPAAPWFMAAAPVVLVPAGTLLVAAAAVVLLGTRRARRDRWRPTFAVVAHSTVVLALQQAVGLPLDYARQTWSTPATLSSLLPMLDENSFAAHLVGSIGLFQFWWLVSLAVGLGVVYRRPAAPLAARFALVYVGAAVALAVAKALLAGA